MKLQRFERSDLAWVAVRGGDRVRFLHAMLTNAVSGLEVGEGNRTLLLSNKGKVVADGLLLVTEDAVLLGCDGRAREALVAGLDHYRVADDVAFSLLEARSTHVLGEEAAAAIEARLGIGLSDQPFHHLAAGSTRGVTLPLGATPGVLLVESEPSGPEGPEAIVDLPVGDAIAFTRLRVAAGEPAWGLELGPEVFPQEVGLEGCLHATKGCYLGQETMVRIGSRGQVRWKLVGLALERGLASAGDPVFISGEGAAEGAAEVGQVSSAALLFDETRPVALASLRQEASAEGTALTVMAKATARDGAAYTHELSATVVPLPFV